MPVYDAATALLVIDVQNDFADPRGSLFVREGDRVVGGANEAIRTAREAGALVVATQDWHPAHTPHFAQDGGVWPVHCVHDTWGAELHAELEPIRDVVRKGVDGKDGYSGFSVRDPETGEVGATPLEEVLRAARIERLVICGLATDYCVVETVSDARMLGYPVEVLGSAIRAVDLEPGDGDRAIGRIRDAGAELV
jgi:nicotinamidase/pyrazinamidase